MSVEQTTQLIQLILNSVLLTVVCVIALGCLGVRQSALEDNLRSINRQYASLLQVAGESRSSQKLSLFQNRFVQAKKILRQLKRCYILTYYSLLTIYYAFFFSVLSLLMLSARTLINADWLIRVALGLFTLSILGLLLGVGLTLIDLHHSQRPFWEDMEEMFGITKISGKPSRSTLVHPLRVSGRVPRNRALELRSAPRGARVG